jgi:hypothetical protein
VMALNLVWVYYRVPEFTEAPPEAGRQQS